ncbi:hypothetical protein [Virgisporangium aliadipatigenens]|uniref:hypothetical protein n=1 Tax=Virgisporangium aliadipatigenens TaxID=741659 RepID=UPI0019407B35|nr:hypothetical protein [Virgisporangium aliadipatigenens]
MTLMSQAAVREACLAGFSGTERNLVLRLAILGEFDDALIAAVSGDSGECAADLLDSVVVEWLPQTVPQRYRVNPGLKDLIAAECDPADAAETHRAAADFYARQANAREAETDFDAALRCLRHLVHVDGGAAIDQLMNFCAEALARGDLEFVFRAVRTVEPVDPDEPRGVLLQLLLATAAFLLSSVDDTEGLRPMADGLEKAIAAASSIATEEDRWLILVAERVGIDPSADTAGARPAKLRLRASAKHRARPPRGAGPGTITVDPVSTRPSMRSSGRWWIGAAAAVVAVVLAYGGSMTFAGWLTAAPRGERPGGSSATPAALPATAPSTTDLGRCGRWPVRIRSFDAPRAAEVEVCSPAPQGHTYWAVYRQLKVGGSWTYFPLFALESGGPGTKSYAVPQPSGVITTPSSPECDKCLTDTLGLLVVVVADGDSATLAANRGSDVAASLDARLLIAASDPYMIY